MSEENPQPNNPSENFATGNAPLALDSNAAMGMAVYEPKLEPQNEPNDYPPEFAAEDVPQFFHQGVPEDVQVNDYSRPDKGKSGERVPWEQVHGNNVPVADERGRPTGSPTGSRVRFDENSPSRRPRENESRRMGSHGGGSHRGQSHRNESHGREPRRTDDRDRKSYKKESHHSKTSESHRSSSHTKDTHRSGSDRKDSQRSESRRSDCQKRDSHKSSKKDDSHKTRKIDATPKYGRPSFFASLGHMMGDTTYVRYPVETKRKGK
ncbi:hypothetical protein FPANT_13275 [Fusarium pseudoanthophilum]|uniref:Uncharacterized protein n=1 Tax=Fusarium pseudoanthophilum TaxID=48495 RepID=A0A8H5NMP9_9HYPO|nr:hypothetical protein FPANT_13275 [Fusarium pseudoanthophilum]